MHEAYSLDTKRTKLDHVSFHRYSVSVNDRESITAAPPSELDEVALIARLKAGDENAAELFVRTFAGRMRAVARRMMSGNDSDADDVVQDAFLSAFRAIDRFKGDSRLATWLHRITINAALMKLRSKRSRPEQSLDDLLPRFSENGHLTRQVSAWTETAERLAMREETRRMVLELISELPAPYRDVIMLRDIEELDTAETASILSISDGAVKTRLHRARLALRTLLEQKLIQT